MFKHPLQNRTNVQIKGGGGQRPFEQCSKKLHFFETGASLSDFNVFFLIHAKSTFYCIIIFCVFMHNQILCTEFLQYSRCSDTKMSRINSLAVKLAAFSFFSKTQNSPNQLCSHPQNNVRESIISIIVSSRLFSINKNKGLF